MSFQYESFSLLLQVHTVKTVNLCLTKPNINRAQHLVCIWFAIFVQ